MRDEGSTGSRDRARSKGGFDPRRLALQFRTVDTETYRITHERQVPPLVCVTEKVVGEESSIHVGEAAVERCRQLLDCPDVILTHNMFDTWVMAAAVGSAERLLERLAAGMWLCTETAEKLVRVRSGQGSAGRTGVEALMLQYEGLDLHDLKKGEDAWRLNYSQLHGVPVRPGLWRGPRSVVCAGAPRTDDLFDRSRPSSNPELGAWHVRDAPLDRWPFEALDYALGDVEHQERIAEHQWRWWLELVDRDRAKAARSNVTLVIPGEEEGILNLPQQSAAAAAFVDMTNTGIFTDGELARRIRDEMARQVRVLRPRLVQAGFLVPKTGSVFTARYIERERAGQTRLSEGEPYEFWEGAWQFKAGRIRDAIERILKSSAPRTDPSSKHPRGQVKKDRYTVELAAESLALQIEGDERAGDAYTLRLLTGLQYLAGYNGCEYQITHYLEPFIAAADERRPMRSRFNVLVNSGRASSTSAFGSHWDSLEGVWIERRDGTNMQNLPKRVSVQILGSRCGVPDPKRWASQNSVRSCVIAPPGHVLLERDYNSIELGAYAHVCRAFRYNGQPFESWGTSALMDIINSGTDPHSLLATRFRELSPDHEAISYEELRGRAKGIAPYEYDPAFKMIRDSAKPVNFGVLGGMQPPKFQYWVRSQYGWRWDLRTIECWFAAHSAMVYDKAEVMDAISWQAEVGLPVVQLWSMRVRGGCTFTSRLNSWFQGLAADGAKRALFMLTCASKIGRYPIATLPSAEAPPLNEYIDMLETSPNEYSARVVVGKDGVSPAPKHQWRYPTRTTTRWGLTTYWVDDDRLARVGFRPNLFVHDSAMGVARDPGGWECRERGSKLIWTPPAALREADACLSEIMCRGMQPVMPGILVQTEGDGGSAPGGGVLRERWS